MGQFKLPPISPLIGSTIPSYWGTIKDRKIEKKHRLKVVLTTIVVLISNLFQWYEKIYFNLRQRKFKLQNDPIFIIGHWRTGTTFLHNIMSQDKQMGYVTTYQTVFPNNLLSKFIFRTFMKVHIPKTRPGDNVKLSVNYPQEDEFALSNINPLNYYQYMYFPMYYQDYYDKYIRFENMSDPTYNRWKQDYKRMVMKAMINTGRDIPLLKNPCTTGRIKVMLELYPDAKFIFIIRNPVIVFLSSKKFFSELLPTLWFHSLEEEDLEEMIFNIYDSLIHDYLEQKSLIPEKNLIEIKFDEYETDPLYFLQKVYHDFSLPKFEEAKPHFANYISNQSGYKKNKYDISKELLRRIIDRWGFSMELWDYSIPENVEVK